MNQLKTLIPILLITIPYLQGGACWGPNYPSNCVTVGEESCFENNVAICELRNEDPDGGNSSWFEVQKDCTALGKMCTVIRTSSGDRFEGTWDSGQAECLDICDAPREVGCRDDADGDSKWQVCHPWLCPLDESFDPPLMDCSQVMGEVQGIVFEHVDGTDTSVEPSDSSVIHVWTDTDLACISCSSSCGCDVGFQCQNGYCLPGEVDEEVLCCGRERGTDCPQGQACEALDGSTSVCATGERCDVCETDSDCGQDVCVATGDGLPKVCLPESESDIYTVECRDDLNEVWKRDVCGNWTEFSGVASVVSTECRDETNQLWTRDLCDNWTELVQDCGDASRCEASDCVENLPEIEVSPTLLDFGDTPVTTTQTMGLSIGNIGYTELSVSEIVVEPAFADLFTVSSPSTQVAVNDIVDVMVTFAPEELGEFRAKLFVRSDDGDEPEITVLMNGQGVSDN